MNAEYDKLMALYKAREAKIQQFGVTLERIGNMTFEGLDKMTPEEKISKVRTEALKSLGWL